MKSSTLIQVILWYSITTWEAKPFHRFETHFRYVWGSWCNWITFIKLSLSVNSFNRNRAIMSFKLQLKIEKRIDGKISEFKRQNEEKRLNFMVFFVSQSFFDFFWMKCNFFPLQTKANAYSESGGKEDKTEFMDVNNFTDFSMYPEQNASTEVQFYIQIWIWIWIFLLKIWIIFISFLY